MSNIAFLFLPLAFSSLPAVLPFVSPSSQVIFLWRLGREARKDCVGKGFCGFWRFQPGQARRWSGKSRIICDSLLPVGRELGGRELETGTWGRELRTGNWGQGTWDRELGAGNWDRELGTGNWGQQTGGRELGQGTGDRELGTGDLGQGTGGSELGAAN